MRKENPGFQLSPKNFKSRFLYSVTDLQVQELFRGTEQRFPPNALKTLFKLSRVLFDL